LIQGPNFANASFFAVSFEQYTVCILDYDFGFESEQY